MNWLNNLLYKNEYSFASVVMRYAFGIYFLLVGVKKFRGDGGYLGFADAVSGGAMNTELLANDVPWILLYSYGLLLPIVELAAGVLLLINKQVRLGYSLVALSYLTFIFGQMYSGNTGKIGTDYLPSLVALCIAVYAHYKAANK